MKTYSLEFTPLALQMLEEIGDKKVQAKILERIQKLTTDPEIQGKPLTGILKSCRSVRAVGQRYRVVYRIFEDRVVVTVIGVGIRKEGSRKDVYARLEQELGDE